MTGDDPYEDARAAVLRRGEALRRWHRVDAEFSDASQELLDALADPFFDPEELVDLRMAVWVKLQLYNRVSDELVPLEAALDEALLVLADVPFPIGEAA